MNLRFIKALAFSIFIASCAQNTAPEDAINAISNRSAIVVQVNDFGKFQKEIESSVPGSILQQSFLVAGLNGVFNSVQSQFDVMPKKFYAGFEQSGAASFEWLFAVSTKDLPVDTLEKKLQTLSHRKYSTTKIYSLDGEEPKLFVSEKNGVVILSRSVALIEGAIRQLESESSLLSDKTLAELLKTINPKDAANIFVQHKYAATWLELHFAKGTLWPTVFSSWSALDLSFDAQSVSISGLCDASDSSNTYLSTFANTGTATSRSQEIIPTNAALVVTHACANVGNWHKNFEVYLGNQNRLKKRNVQLEEDKVNTTDWLSWVDEEWGVFYTEGTQELHLRKFGFIRVKKMENALKDLNALSADQPIDFRGYQIYNTTKRNILPLIFGRLFSYMSQPYWFVHQNWVLFAPDIESAKTLIISIATDKTWANFNPIDKDLIKKDQHISVYTLNPELLQMIDFEVVASNKKALKGEKETLSAISQLVVHTKVKGKWAYTECVMRESINTTVQTKQYFATKLDAPVIRGPFYAVNHTNKQGEIVVQDQANTLYLIGSTGNILWKKNIGEPVIGEVTQIDIYKNNKLQLVFNTASNFYVVDRNGNDVAPFPIKLPEQATAPAAIMDYDKNRNYRVLIPCGKRLLNYTLDGKQVSGWQFKKASTDIITKPAHAMHGGKDYVYFADADGGIYLLDRRGEKREKVKQNLGGMQSGHLFFAVEKNEPSLKSLGVSGYLRTLTLGGALDSVQPFRQKPNAMQSHGSTSIFASDNYLYVRSEKLNLNIELEEKSNASPQILFTNKQIYFAISTQNDAVWLFDEKGNVLPGMPLFGTGNVVLGKLIGQESLLLVASPDGAVLAYKLGQ